MKTILLLLGVMTSQLSLAEVRPEVRVPTQPEVKPELIRSVDLIERVQVCGNGRCQQVPVRDIIRQIQDERARGGDIIGNGGGLGEMNFVYALTNLADFIMDTVRNDGIVGRDADQLIRIAALARRESRKQDKLVFISGQKNPGIFNIQGETRLAVTGDSATAPIFVNLDLVYKKTFDVTDILTLPEIVSLLVHELGHQVGLLDHAYLDYLGARVRRMISRDINRITRNMADGLKVEITSFSYWSSAAPKIQLGIENSLRDFNEDVSKVMKCEDGSRPMSARLSNQHLTSPPVDFDPNIILSFRGWMEMACMKAGVVKLEYKTLVLDVLIEKNENFEMRVIQAALKND